MKVVLDTNIILASFSNRSPYGVVMDKFKSREYSLCVTTEILLEYEEKLGQIFSPEAAEVFMSSLPDRSNVEWASVYYNWNLVYPDLDDNKFVDCAIAARADYLVTNDRDFLPLKKLEFPKLEILKIEAFMKLLNA